MKLPRDPCNRRPTRSSLMEAALRSFVGVLTTYFLAGEVDTTLPPGDLPAKLSWLLRYFNPVNLCWRYYSILAYRCLSPTWTDKHLALINYEGYPYRAPIPYLVGEKIEAFYIKRLEISGVVSSQGLLSMIAAYQGVLALQFSILGIEGTLPTITKPIAILALFRVMVSNWIASKVYVEPYPYPTATVELDNKSNKFVVFGWVVAWVGLVMLAFSPNILYPKELKNFHTYYVDLGNNLLYQYTTSSALLFHVVLLSHGPRVLANRILYFDHWIYKAQTFVFVFLLCGTLALGIFDFIWHDYYRDCGL